MRKTSAFYIKIGVIILFCLYSITSCTIEGDKDSMQEIKVYPQLGHSDVISTVIFSPDGRYIVSGAWDATVKLWDADTGREMGTFLGHTGRVEALAISPCGNLFASASTDGIRIWDIRTGKEFIRLEERAFSLAFGSDGATLYTASLNGMKIWDVRKRKIIKVITNQSVSYASFSKSNNYIAYVADGIHILDTATGLTTTMGNNLITTIALSKDGKHIACGSWDGTIELWDIESKKGPEKFQAHPDKINAITFSNDSRYIVTASADNKIALWDIRNINNNKSFFGHTAGVNAIDFSADDRFIISASFDKTIKIWDTASGEEIGVIGAHSDPPLFSVISNDRQYIAAFTQNKRLMLWNPETGHLIDSFEIQEPVSSISFAEDNESIIIVSPDGNLRFYSIKTGKELDCISGNGNELALIRSFSADGKYVAAVLWDGKLQLWDRVDGQKTDLDFSSEVLITALALSPGRRYIGTGFSDGKLLITELDSGKTTVSAQYKNRVESLQFSLDGEKIVCGIQNGEIHLLDAISGKEKAPVMRHLFGINAVSFSADGKNIISSAADNTTNIWDAKTGKKIASFIAFDDDEWIVITSDGYYNSSPRGDERLNIRIGDEIYGMDQFGSLFYQPEVVSSRLRGLPDPEIVSLAGELRMALVPPAIHINAPQESDSGREEIAVFIEDRFHHIKNIQIVINGRLLGTEELCFFNSNNKLAVENTSLVVKEPLHELSFTLPVNLEAGPNRIHVIAFNNYNVSGKNNYSDFLAGAEGRDSLFIYNNSTVSTRAMDLWVLAVGINSYAYGTPKNNLNFSVNNALGIKSLLETQQGKRYRKVYSQIIADGERIAPTRENILKNLDEFFSKASYNDVLVLYMSGHGEDSKNDADKSYYFLPQDASFTPNGEPDYSQAISLDDISVLLDMPGRKFIFIDSCFSGGVDDLKLTKSLKNPSTVIFTSSQQNEFSWEGSEMVGYGVFTESLIQGIRGGASLNNDVKVSCLGDYVYNRVVQFTGDMQHPYIYIPEGAYSFVFAIPDRPPR
jgi:WD40 repeat protein